MVIDVIPPGSIPESGSSSSQWDLAVRIAPVPDDFCVELVDFDDDDDDPVPGDCDGDGVVGILDLLVLLGSWGPCPGCDVDFDGDHMVGSEDLLVLLANWT